MLAGTLRAQNIVTSFSTSVQTGETAAAACAAQRATVVSLVDRFPHPAHWRWIVACDEQSWAFLRQHTTRRDTSNGEVMALTNLDAAITFVRGPYMLHPLDHTALAQPDRIIAHELCHIQLHSADEIKVTAMAREWFRGRTIAQLTPPGN